MTFLPSFIKTCQMVQIDMEYRHVYSKIEETYKYFHVLSLRLYVPHWP